MVTLSTLPSIVLDYYYSNNQKFPDSCLSGLVYVECTEALYNDNPDVKNSRQEKSGILL